MITQKTLDLIKHYESLHDGNLKQIGLQPKLCPAGIATIGYGHAVSDKGAFLKGAEGLKRATELYPAFTIQQADELLLEDLQRFSSIVTSACKHNMQDERIGALVSFCFNVGQGSFMSSTLLRKLNKPDIAGAGEEFLRWNKAKVNGQSKELKGLTARRRSERHLFLTGELKFFN